MKGVCVCVCEGRTEEDERGCVSVCVRGCLVSRNSCVMVRVSFDKLYSCDHRLLSTEDYVALTVAAGGFVS